MKAFHAQLGERVRTQDALRVASSFFSDGLEKFKAGELELALSLFEQTLAVNQKYAPMCKTIWLRPRPARLRRPPPAPGRAPGCSELRPASAKSAAWAALAPRPYRPCFHIRYLGQQASFSTECDTT